MHATAFQPIPSKTAYSQRIFDSLLARRALRQTGYASLSAVDVEVTNGVVWLKGEVPTLFLREIAQDSVRSVPGMHNVRCDIRIE